MKFTLNWLKDHLDTSKNLDTIAETLTNIGLEIENVEAEHSKQSNIPSAGRIQWTYGESIQFSETYFTQIPKAKEVAEEDITEEDIKEWWAETL